MTLPNIALAGAAMLGFVALTTITVLLDPIVRAAGARRRAKARHRYAYEVRTLNGRVLSRHRSMFLAACAAAFWNIFHDEPAIHWVGAWR